MEKLTIDRQQRFTFVSQAAAHALGLPVGEFPGKTWKALGLRPEAMLPLSDLCASVSASRQAARRAFPWLTVDGVRRVECIATPLFGADNDVTAVVCVARDITEAQPSANGKSHHAETRMTSGTA